MKPAPSTRLDIVRAALTDIVERLAEAPVTDTIRDLRKRAARYERIVASWKAVPPSEDERASVMREVLELNVAVMKAGGDAP